MPVVRLDQRRAGVGTASIAVRTIAVLALVAMVACSAPGRTGAAPRPMSPRPPASPSNPPYRSSADLDIAARGIARRRLRTAVEDLRRIGVWPRLTRHLYVVKLGARPGRANVPPDAHLADAVRSAYVDARGQGLLCDVVVFPAAITADLARWRSYHAAGLLPQPAPPPRHFWAAIVGHEIAHCLAHRAPEQVAISWEEKILALLDRPKT